MSGTILQPKDVMRVESPGAGGFGNPHNRDPELVRLDVLDGRVSRKSAEQAYGVVLDTADEVDAEQTSLLRRSLGSVGSD